VSRKENIPDTTISEILENAPGIIVVQDTEQNVLWANKEFYSLANLDADQLIGKKCWNTLGRKKPCRNCPVIEVFRTGEPAETEVAHENQDNWPESQSSWLARAVPLRGEEGKIIGAIETVFEISDRKIIERIRLDEEKGKFQTLAENTLDAIILIDNEGKVREWNPAAEKMFGYSASEAIGENLHNLVIPEQYLDSFKKGFKLFRKTGKGKVVGKVRELTAKHKSGLEIPIEVSVSPIQIRDKLWAVATIRNIAERKRFEEKISYQLRLLSGLFHSSVQIMEHLDTKSIAGAVVRTCVEVFGVNMAWLGLAQKDGTFDFIGQYPGIVSSPLTAGWRWDGSPEGQGPIGVAIRLGSPHIIEDITDDPRFIPWKDAALKTGNITTFAALPLIGHEGAFGVLSLSSDQAHFFDQERVAQLQSFAHLVATALEKARIHEESKRRLERITALRNIDIAITGSLDLRVIYRVVLDEIIRHLKADAVDILTLDPHTMVMEYQAGKGFRTSEMEEFQISLNDGSAGRVARERKTIYIPDISQIDTRVFTRRDLMEKEGLITYYGTPLLAKGKLIGVLEIYYRSTHRENAEWANFLETLAGQVTIAIENAGLVDDLHHQHMGLLKAYDETIEGWAMALSLKEYETAQHSQRVTRLTLGIARRMGMRDGELVHVRRGALLHDIGKIGIPDSILLKPGKLTAREWEIMKKHPVYAFEMLAPIAYLAKAINIPYCHHEKWDGTGYPRGLKGKQIPLEARIFAVVDFWDANRSDRPYRKARPSEEVLERIQKLKGIHFDPDVVETFIQVVSEE